VLNYVEKTLTIIFVSCLVRIGYENIVFNTRIIYISEKMQNINGSVITAKNSCI